MLESLDDRSAEYVEVSFPKAGEPGSRVGQDERVRLGNPRKRAASVPVPGGDRVEGNPESPAEHRPAGWRRSAAALLGQRQAIGQQHSDEGPDANTVRSPI